VIRYIWHELRLNWWILLGLAAGLVGFIMYRRRPDRAIVFATPFLKRAHEADVDAEIAKQNVDAKAAREIREIREGLKNRLDQIEIEKLDNAAKMSEDADELLEYYRRRSRELL
tara:strand:+ start:342 stop:683 length:342 start_codon:yes stop_codon:yes gene_type:complete